MIMYKKYVVLQYWGKYNYQKNEFARLGSNIIYLQLLNGLYPFCIKIP